MLVLVVLPIIQQEELLNEMASEWCQKNEL